jgi:flagellar assembly protein FliH
MPSSNRYYTRFIPREEVGDVTRWQFGAVDGDIDEALRPLVPPEPEPEAAPPASPPPAPGPSAQEVQSLLRQADEEGYARGLAEGREQARLQGQQQLDDYVGGQGREAASRYAQLAQALEDSFAGLQQSMAQEVLQLACDIARQVVRQEVASNPRAVLPVVREALSMLVNESRPVTVRLHPGDWAVLEQPLRQEFGAGRIQWQADAAVQPGDCLVESAGMTIDGTLDKRWRRAIAALGLTQAWREDGDAD